MIRIYNILGLSPSFALRMWAKWRGVRDRAPVVAPKALLQISGVAYIVTGACGNVCQDIDVVKWHGLRLWGDVPGEGGRRAPGATPGHFFQTQKARHVSRLLRLKKSGGKVRGKTKGYLQVGKSP